MDKLDTHQRLLKLIEAQNRKTVPVLPYAYAHQALTILKDAHTNQIYLISAAANYLNAFVKQVESSAFKDAYVFKARLIDRLIASKLRLESFCFLDGDTLLIECEGLQFSFHHVDVKAIEKVSHLSAKPWSRLRLQAYALEIFKDALSVNQPDQNITT
jgi:hypothetical protein